MIGSQFAAAGAPPTSATAIWAVGVLSLLGTVISAILVYRSSGRATKVNASSSMSEQQLKWTQQAMSEATMAKADAKAATESASAAEVSARAAGVAADSATRRADAAETRLREVSDLADDLMRWIERVVRKSHVDGINDGVSPAVAELLRTINGGPPELSSSRLRREQ